MVLKKNWLLVVLAFGILIVVGIIIFITLAFFTPWSRCEECRIISDIGQARAVMTYLYQNVGNYDNFNCNHQDMKALCGDIDINFGKEDGKEPIITHDALINSQAVCIYSPLNQKRNDWYCADSSGFKGRAGYTEINPDSLGYCVEGQSAVCPPFVE